MKTRILTVLLALALAVPAQAQISIPNTFVANTRIVSADVNENFTELGDKALNREGGAMTGDLIISTNIKPDVTGGADIGTTLLRFGTMYVDNVDVDGGLVLDTLTVEDTSAASIDTAGGITAGSGSVAIIDATGKIPEISSTYFASLTGANLTGILETAIADGAIFPRVASAETITAQWTFQPAGAPALFHASAATSNVFAAFGRASDEQSRIIFLSSGGSNHGALQADTDTISILTGAGLGTSASFSPTTINLTASGNLNFAGTGITNSGTYGTGTTQPGFLAYKSAATTVADGGTVTFNTELYDTGGVFGSNTFTAPVTGTYQICYGLDVIPTGTGEVQIRLTAAGAVYPAAYDATALTLEHLSACYILPMAATNTAALTYHHGGADGADIGLASVSSRRSAYFTARLVP